MASTRPWRRCATFALVDRETIADERDPAITTEAIRLHRLVREVAARGARARRARRCRRILSEACAAVYPQERLRDPTDLAAGAAARCRSRSRYGRRQQHAAAWGGDSGPAELLHGSRLVQACGARRPMRQRDHCSSARWRSARRCSARSIPIRRRASTTSPSCLSTRATLPGRGRSTSVRWRSARRCSARASRYGDEPQQPRRPASRPGRLRGSAAALRARAGDLREGARPGASRHGDEPQQSRQPASGPRRPRRGAAALRARAGDPREGARPGASRYGDEPQQPRRPAPGTRATLRERGRSTSARWRSARRCSAQSIPIRR